MCTTQGLRLTKAAERLDIIHYMINNRLLLAIGAVSRSISTWKEWDRLPYMHVPGIDGALEVLV